VADSGVGGSQAVAIGGEGLAIPVASVSIAGITFPATYVGSSSPSQSVTLTNGGGAALEIARITADPVDFAVHSSCPDSLLPGESCEVGVAFVPMTGGTKAGVLTIEDSAAGSPRRVALGGTGRDFDIVLAGPSVATVNSGATATYMLNVQPAGGFDQDVALRCVGLPAHATCVLSRSQVALNGNDPISVVVTVETDGELIAAAPPLAPSRRASAIVLLAMLSSVPGLLLLRRRDRAQDLRRSCSLAMAFLFFALAGTACVTEPKTPTYFQIVGNFTSDSASLSHSSTLTLVVH